MYMFSRELNFDICKSYARVYGWITKRSQPLSSILWTWAQHALTVLQYVNNRNIYPNVGQEGVTESLSLGFSVYIEVTYFDFSIPIALLTLRGIKWRKRTGKSVNAAWMQIPTLKFSNWSDDIWRNEARLAPKKELKVAPMLFKDMKREKSVPSIPGSHNWPESTKNGINLLKPKDIKQTTTTTYV